MSKQPQRRKNYVAAWRKHRNMTQEELGELAGMSGGNVSLIERGAINYTTESLDKLATALGCEPGDLLKIDPGKLDELDAVLAAIPSEQRRRAARLLKAMLNDE